MSATATDEDGTYAAGNTVDVLVEHAAVAERMLFYGNSYFSTGGDDNAIATDKAALLPGQTAAFVNYSSYSKGINGIMVDLAGTFGSISADDFVIRVGNSNDPSSWANGPTPTVTVRTGAGVNGAARIELTWADNAIADEWVQVTVVANMDTGLAADDVFYFGNAIGESGDSSTDAMVTQADEDGACNNPANLAVNLATVTDDYDYNRDGKVNSIDQIIARNNTTTADTALKLISLGGEFNLVPGVGSTAPDTTDTGPTLKPSNSGNPVTLLPTVSLGMVTTIPAGTVRTVTLVPSTTPPPSPTIPSVIKTVAVTPTFLTGQGSKQQKPASTLRVSTAHLPITPMKRRNAGNLLLGFENLWNWIFYKH